MITINKQLKDISLEILEETEKKVDFIRDNTTILCIDAQKIINKYLR